MPFVWTNTPNLPTVIPPKVLGPNETSTQVHVVANTVNVHGLVIGTLSYNTANKGYDVVYELPSLNSNTLLAHTINVISATINTAYINTATINIATINTANISTATIANGIMGVHPVQNLQIATKEYVDLLVANSTPLGGNIQLLIQASGDLLVGVSDNTAERLAVGTSDGQILVAGGSGNTGLFWRDQIDTTTFTGTFHNLVIGTDPLTEFKNTRVKLVSVDAVVMNDGSRVSGGWSGLTASTTANGAVGFLDTGVVASNTWYEVWAVRNSSTGAKGLLLHQALDRRADIVAHIIGSGPGITRSVRFTTTGAHVLNAVNVAQGFLATKSGPLTAIDIAVRRVGAPVGNCWITLEANTAGNASGIPLSTSRIVDVSRFVTSNVVDARVRFPFDTNTANVVTGNSYFFVYHVDYTPAGSGNPNYVIISGYSNLAAGVYSGGISKNFSSNTNSWEITNSGAPHNAPIGPGVLWFRTYVETNTSNLILPSGYDQKCLLSYATTGANSVFKEYSQLQRRMIRPFHVTWRVSGFGGGVDASDRNCIPIDLSSVVPPVPCIVVTTIQGGFGGSLTAGIANITTTDVGGLDASAQATFFETEGAAYSNAIVGVVCTFAPILVDGQCMQVLTGESSRVYLTAVEF